MRRADPQQMARWLARRASAGLSWAQLSRRSGHPVWKLRYWQRRFDRAAGARRRGGFVAVEVAEPAVPPGTIAITTPAGYRLEVPHDVDAEGLRRVVEALERRCSAWGARRGWSAPRS